MYTCKPVYQITEYAHHPHLMRQKGFLAPSCQAPGGTRRADEKSGEGKNWWDGERMERDGERMARVGKSGMTDTLGSVG